MKIDRQYSNLTTSYVKQKETIQKDNKMAQASNDKNEFVQSVDELEEKIDSINSFFKPTNSYLKFKLHEKLDEYYVSIIDQETNEVIKEIPAKELLDIHAKIEEMLGILIDEKI